MSSYLWRYYYEDDVANFRQLLETAGYTQKGQIVGHGINTGAGIGSLGSSGTSPTLTIKGRKIQEWTAVTGTASVVLTRADINRKDATGLTILHHAASSTSENAFAFASALLEHTLTDVYAQDLENGWTALHRAFYFGNISIARSILERDLQDMLGHGVGTTYAGGLIKIKDKEGNGPFDLYATTIKDRTLRPAENAWSGANPPEDDEDELAHGDSGDKDDSVSRKRLVRPSVDIQGDEVFTFGSNRNITLGFGDEDDRQFPERIALRRPDHLLYRFYREHLAARRKEIGSSAPSSTVLESTSVSSLPAIIRNKPLIIQDVQMSKLHTAVLTADPEANLYMCGHGPGGRLGTGDETTRFQFVCIEGGALSHKRVVALALGQSHTLTVSEEGEIFSWGNNAFGQLGYALPKTTLHDEDPIQTLPRQIFGPLKREVVIGVAASRIHSVAYTTTSLYTFGKNEGQLGIVDSDARSLEFQDTPRKVAASLFSSPIASVSAIDRATICLLENHEVWVFTNYGYRKMLFPLDGFTNYFLKNSFLTTKYDTSPNRICKITSGGDTICAMTSSGEVFTATVSQRADPGPSTTTSTTNPSKIRDAISQPHRIWSLKKGHMAARDVEVDHDGSIILTTEAGTVWRRVKRAKIKDASAAGTSEYKPKDYKFSRIPGLTRAVAVRASAYGAYAAVRKDCDVTRTQIVVDDQTLWKDLYPLLPFRSLADRPENSDDEDPSPRFWQRPQPFQLLVKRVLSSKDLERELADVLRQSSARTGAALFSNSGKESGYDMKVQTNISDVCIPLNQFLIAGRSRIIRQGLESYRRNGSFTVPNFLIIERNDQGQPSLNFQGLDFLTVFNLVLYLYTDTVVDFWHYTRQHPKSAFRYRQVRTELMKVAVKLELTRLEPAVRQMVEPKPSLDEDMEIAFRDATLFDNGDVLIQLADGNFRVHSALMCQRCPFFEGLFKGRAGGRWLSERRDLLEEPSDAIDIDLKHIDSTMFQMVLRHVYADTGEELFDSVATDSLDEYLDMVMDVMGIANELMLDRLSQICQKTIGRYVNVRNVCQLLNAVAPSSVTEFKDAGLEYLCLSLEAMLPHGLLDELDEDLLFELDIVVRENQLACLPFARSGRAEALLHEKYPELAERIDRARQAKIDSIKLQQKYAEGEDRIPGSFKGDSWEDPASSSLQPKARRQSSKTAKGPAANPRPSPSLKGKRSAADLMFNMDDEENESSPSIPVQTSRSEPDVIPDSSSSKTLGPPMLSSGTEGRGLESKRPLDVQNSTLGSFSPLTPSTPGAAAEDLSVTSVNNPLSSPWGAVLLQTAKHDMKNIMAQTSASRTSNLSLGLAAQATTEKSPGSSVAKMSQKERKKLQQAQQLAVLNSPSGSVSGSVSELVSDPKPASPWRTVSSGPKVAIKDLSVASPSPPPASPQVNRTITAPPLTLRQTVANKPEPKQKAASSLSSPQPSASQHRSVSYSRPVNEPGPLVNGDASRPPTLPLQPKTSIIRPSANPTPIQSIRHISPRSAEPALQLSMADILAQQQAEKDIIKEAAAKRSLQEIQQEQEFQEWWDQESRRVMEEEAARTARATRGSEKRGGRGRGAGAGRGKGRGGGESRGKPTVPTESGPSASTGGTRI